jgi:hypothetical protein
MVRLFAGGALRIQLPVTATSALVPQSLFGPGCAWRSVCFRAVLVLNLPIAGQRLLVEGDDIQERLIRADRCVRLGSKPGPLPLRVLPCGLFHCLSTLSQRHLTAQILPNLADTNHLGSSRADWARGSDLFDRA